MKKIKISILFKMMVEIAQACGHKSDEDRTSFEYKNFKINTYMIRKGLSGKNYRAAGSIAINGVRFGFSPIWSSRNFTLFVQKDGENLAECEVKNKSFITWNDEKAGERIEEEMLTFFQEEYPAVLEYAKVAGSQEKKYIVPDLGGERIV